MTKLTKEAIEARRLYYKTWREKNKEKLKQKRKDHYQKNKEQHKKWNEEYWERKGKKGQIIKNDNPDKGDKNE
jgi:hypothetical protein